MADEKKSKQEKKVEITTKSISTPKIVPEPEKANILDKPEEKEKKHCRGINKYFRRNR